MLPEIDNSEAIRKFVYSVFITLWMSCFASSWNRITDLRFGLIKQFFIAVHDVNKDKRRVRTPSRHLQYTTVLRGHSMLLTDLTPTLTRPMKDIKEYFTANKHPLISRSARINQRLRATTGLERRRIRQCPVAAVSTVATGGEAGVSCGDRQMAAGDASSRDNAARFAVIHEI